MWLADYINVLWAIKQVYLVKWQVTVSNYCTDQSKSFSSLHFTSWWSKLWWNQITPLIFPCNCNTVTVQSVCLCISLSVLCTCLSVFNCVCPFSLYLCIPGDRAERVPREGPAGCVPHQGQQGSRGVPAGYGACQWEPHRGASWHPA